MIKFAICPHDTKKGLDRWERIIKSLEDIFSQEIKPILFKNHFEEVKKLESDKIEIDIYYASPDVSLELSKRGFIPLAKFGNQQDAIYIIKKQGKKISQNPKAGINTYKYMYLGLLEIHSRFEYVDIIPVCSYTEIIKKLINNQIDIGFIYKDYYDQLPENIKNQITVIKKIQTIFHHSFMVKKDFYKKHKNKLEKFIQQNALKKIPPETLKSFDFIYNITDILKRIEEEKAVLKSIMEFPHIFILIYHKTYMFANKAFLKFSGYSLEELKKLKPEDIIADEEDKPLIKEIANRRIKGEFFKREYAQLKIKTKEGKTKYLLAFSKTIFYEGKYVGVVLAIDITKKKRIEEFYRFIREINQLIIKEFNENKIFQKAVDNLIDIVEFEKAGFFKLEDDRARLVYGRNTSEEEAKFAEFMLYRWYKDTRYPTLIISDIDKSNLYYSVRNKIKSYGYSSFFVIPIFKKNKIYGFLTGGSSEKGFINKDVKSILNEIKKDLGFALDKIENLKDLQIITNAIEKSKEWFMITDSEGRIIYANQTVSRISGYKKEELIGNTPRIFKSEYQTQNFYKKLWKSIKAGKDFEAVFVNRTKDGKLFYLDLLIHPIKLKNKEIYFVATGRDITKEVYLSSEVEKYKFYDPLTQLLNAYGFSFNISEKLKNTRNLGALIIIDIYNMSYINNVYGEDTGDKLLQFLAKQLETNFKKEDIKARIGGDEFGLFIYGLKKKEDIKIILERIYEIFSNPVKINGFEIEISFDIGISIYPVDGRSFQTLYKKAFIALTSAKKEGKNVIKFYNPQMEKLARKSIFIENLVKKAIKENLFVFHYQPYFSQKEFKLAGAECLVRIKDGEKIYFPNTFIDFLEKSEFITEFEDILIKNAVEKIKQWGIKISINISGRSFLDKYFYKKFENIPQDIRQNMILEVTERELLRDIKLAQHNIQNLKKLGLSIAIDDFGTGYSSFSYLKDLQIDILKIDISFIRDMLKGKSEQAIVETIIQLAHRLGMKTLAEGVEEKEQIKMLQNFGCDYLQGYYFQKPTDEESFNNYLNQILKS